MKTKDVAKQYGIEQISFERFLERKSYNKTNGIMGMTIADSDVEEAVKEFKAEKEKDAEWRRKGQEQLEENNRREQERKHKESELKRAREAALPNILISSGFSFEGYRITKYSGYISGDDAVQIPRSGVFGGNNGQNLTDALVKIRRQALKELKEAAFDLGCNAVIGVDFDYITLEPETANIGGGTLYEPYIICVTANGNAVVIEKE